MGKKRLTRKQMWERITALTASLRIDQIAEKVLPEVQQNEIVRLADRQLTSDIRRWLLAQRKKDDPEQLTLIEREEGVGSYESLDVVPEPLLRRRSRKLRIFGMALLRIADAIDAHLTVREQRAAERK